MLSNFFSLPHIAKTSPKKLVYYAGSAYSPSTLVQLLFLYRIPIHPCMGYGFHLWGHSTFTSLLDRMESKAFCIINFPTFTDSLHPLSLLSKGTSLFLLYCFYTGHCSFALPNSLDVCLVPSGEHATLAKLLTLYSPFYPAPKCKS